MLPWRDGTATCRGSVAPADDAPTDGSATFAWSTDDLRDTRTWVHRLTAEETAECDAALHHPAVRGRPVELIDVDAFERPTITRLCRRITAALRDGPGLFLVRGLPVVNHSEADLERLLWGLGSLLGVPVPQTVGGDRLRRVEDLGSELALPSVRGHETNAPLALHSDRCDVVALLCVRPAAEGGTSIVVSADQAHELLRQRAPELLPVLYEPYPNDQRGEQPAGAPRWIPLPVFSMADGKLVTRYIRRFIMDAQRFPDVPRLSARQIEALDALDVALGEPDAAVRMQLEAGDLQLLNSHRTLHGREAFADHDARRRRLLLRLWLSPPWSQRLPDVFRPLFGAVEAGVVRGGIAVRAG